MIGKVNCSARHAYDQPPTPARSEAAVTGRSGACKRGSPSGRRSSIRMASADFPGAAAPVSHVAVQDLVLVARALLLRVVPSGHLVRQLRASEVGMGEHGKDGSNLLCSSKACQQWGSPLLNVMQRRLRTAESTQRHPGCCTGAQPQYSTSTSLLRCSPPGSSCTRSRGPSPPRCTGMGEEGGRCGRPSGSRSMQKRAGGHDCWP